MINLVEILTSTIENRIEAGQPVPFGNAINLQNPDQVNMLMFCLELISNTAETLADFAEDEEGEDSAGIPENYHCGGDCEACGEMTLDKYQYINTQLRNALQNFFRASNAVELPRGIGKTTRMVVAKALLSLLEHEGSEPETIVMPLGEAKEIYHSASALLSLLGVEHTLEAPTNLSPNTVFSLKVKPITK